MVLKQNNLIQSPNFIKKSDNLSGNQLLDNIGWNYAIQNGILVDGDGDFIPWYNYTVVEFLKTKLNKNLVIFEYGCGFSSLFYAKRIKSLACVDVNTDCISWVLDSCKKLNFKNIEIHLTSKEDFANMILNISNIFDVIIIDSVERNKCISTCLSRLSNNGVIILDNSERKNYAKSFILLKENGFKYITFTGIKPLSVKLSSTTIFYRDYNIFEI